MAELGIELPQVVAPVASYVPAVQTGNLVYTAGQLPVVHGELIATGRVGSSVDEETAKECARACALNALAAVVSVIGDIDRIRRIVKVVGFVASEPGYSGQPIVVNGASDVLGEIFPRRQARPRLGAGGEDATRNRPRRHLRGGDAELHHVGERVGGAALNQAVHRGREVAVGAPL